MGSGMTRSPRLLPERSGVTPTLTWPVDRVDACRREGPMASAGAKLNGLADLSLCGFGEAGGHPLPGPVATEELDLAADPVSKHPVPVLGLLVSCREVP